MVVKRVNFWVGMRRATGNSPMGFSLPEVLVGVFLMGVAATIMSQMMVNATKEQKRVDLKLTANKSQQALLNGITERVKEFMEDNCSGARWGGGASSEVERAFAKVDITADGGFGLSANFSRDNTVNPRCANPEEVDLGTGKALRFCLEIKPTQQNPSPGTPAYQFTKIGRRIMEVLITPIDLATDKPINCSEVRGAGAGVKVAWQMFNQTDSNNPASITKEVGVFLVSAEGEPSSGNCNVQAQRVGADQCSVRATGLGSRPPTLFKNDVKLSGVVWSREAGSADIFTTTSTCESSQNTTFRAQSSAGQDFCDAPVVKAEPLTCKLRPVQGDLEYWWASVERRPELMVKVTSSHTNLPFPRVVSTGWDPVPKATWSVESSAVQGCPDPPCYRARFLSHDVWMPGRYRVEFWESDGLKGACDAYNYSCWDTTWRRGRMAYWHGGPIIRRLAHDKGVLGVPLGYKWGSIANDKATKDKLCEWQGLSVMFSSTTSSENRNNYSSCGDDNHLKWNGSALVNIPACSSNWVGCLLCN